jgi:hypothetical protein
MLNCSGIKEMPETAASFRGEVLFVQKRNREKLSKAKEKEMILVQRLLNRYSHL